VRTTLKSVLAALVIAGLAGAAAPALAQKPASAETNLTDEWLVGEWHAAQEEVTAYDSTTVSRTQYWLDLTISRRPDGKLEALSTARQMIDETEYVTWKSDVTIKDGRVFITRREIVGKHEWRLFDPDNYELRRMENRLIGRGFKSGIFQDPRLVQFMR
jgi:hypothetical protein